MAHRKKKRVRLELTGAEAEALFLAVGNSLHSGDDAIGIVGAARVRFAYRAQSKLRAAIYGGPDLVAEEEAKDRSERAAARAAAELPIAHARLVAAEQLEVRREFPDWPADQVRAEALRRAVAALGALPRP